MKATKIDSSNLIITETAEEQKALEEFVASGGVTPPIPPDPNPVEPIQAADIINLATADAPFAKQKGSVQSIAKHLSLATMSENGLHGPSDSVHGTLRFGKVNDPANQAKKALSFMVGPKDPKTSGGQRTEIAEEKVIEYGKEYWAALAAYVFKWGNENGSGGLYGIQLHCGDDGGGYSPAFGVYVADATSFRIEQRATGQGTIRSVSRPIRFGGWQDFVFKFKLGFPGYLKCWIDGQLFIDYGGNLGFKTGLKDYFKFGWYNWVSFTQTRRVLLRNPVVVDGTKYNVESLRAFVNG